MLSSLLDFLVVLAIGFVLGSMYPSATANAWGQRLLSALRPKLAAMLNALRRS